jgi:hypothetical protein
VPQEEIKYEIRRVTGSQEYSITIYRMTGNQWKECKRLNRSITLWGAKWAAKRWIKDWSNGKFRDISYMDIIKVDRKWN